MILRRAVAQWSVLAAAFATILLATTVLAATSMLIGSVTQSGVRLAVAAAPRADRTIVVSGAVDGAEDARRLEEGVRAAASPALTGVEAPVWGQLTSVSYSLPLAPGTSEVTHLTVFRTYDDLPDHARLAGGQWAAAPSAGPVPVTMHAEAATRLELEVGDRFRVANRLTDEPVDVVVAGTYRPTDPGEAYWIDDRVGVVGVDEGTTYTTLGPLVVDRAVFVERFLGDASAAWRIEPALGRLSPGQLDATVANLVDFDAALNALDDGLAVRSEVSDLLSGLGTPLLVARSAVAMPSALLVILAAYTLLLTARLLREHRAMENALLRSRGLSGRQLASASVREAAALCLPAAVVAPLLAAAAMRLFDRYGGLGGDEGVSIATSPTVAAWVVSTCAAAGALLVLVGPVWRAPTYVESAQARSRAERRTSLQQAGGDLVLLALAGLAYWQLARYESPILADATGALALDPLLVVAPAVVLLAAAVVVLRLLPGVAILAERIVARGRRALPALGTWELSRRLRRHTGPALLMVLTTAVGTFSVVYATAWSQSLLDQADFRTGADVRVTTQRGAPPPVDLRKVEGVTGVMPALRSNEIRGDLRVQLLAVDAATAPDVVNLRSDLTAEPLDGLVRPLVDGRLAVPTLPLPAEADTVVVPVRLTTPRGYHPQVTVYVVVRDGSGLLRRTTVSTARPRRRDVTLSADVSTLARPVELVAVQVRHSSFVPDFDGADQADWLDVRLSPLRTETADGTDLGPLIGEDPWEPSIIADSGTQGEDFRVARGGGTDQRLDGRVEIGCCGAALLTVAVAGADQPGEDLPTIVTRDLDEVLAGPGSGGSGGSDSGSDAGKFSARPGVATARLTVAGTLEAMPTVDPGEGPAAVIDLQSVVTQGYLQTGEVTSPSEWWVAADDPPAVAQAITRAWPGADVALSRPEGSRLRLDPVGAGILGALAIGTIAAAAFATIGFAVSIGVSAQERRAELAVLRAIGTGARQVSGLIRLEQAVLIGLGLLVGLVIGVLVARLVVPLVTLTGQATTPFPEVQVTVPVATVLLFAAVVAGLLSVTVVAATHILQRRGLGAELRMGQQP